MPTRVDGAMIQSDGRKISYATKNEYAASVYQTVIFGGHSRVTGYSSTIRLEKTCRSSGVDQERYFFWFSITSRGSGGGRLGLPLLRTHDDQPQHHGEFAEHHRENPIGDPLLVLRP